MDVDAAVGTRTAVDVSLMRFRFVVPSLICECGGGLLRNVLGEDDEVVVVVDVDSLEE